MSQQRVKSPSEHKARRGVEINGSASVGESLAMFDNLSHFSQYLLSRFGDVVQTEFYPKAMPNFRPSSSRYPSHANIAHEWLPSKSSKGKNKRSCAGYRMRVKSSPTYQPAAGVLGVVAR